MTDIFLLFGKSFLMTINGNIKFTTNNRFYFQVAILVLMFVSFRNKLKSAKHIAMITDG